ncbi:hypothetical protein BJ138DRAFT_1143607 [Hygrophoropsis aurantiaca]|uniref:Uncharacterized protein n=1 Tax=Hygrophoropsis aurantiaca TaxID=72124 RepID=A0ACB8ANC7_9AGAM|nr:hypothetical protein BJ138DRAFT_1143607 [Hygrophoropsis aurantiaca]
MDDNPRPPKRFRVEHDTEENLQPVASSSSLIPSSSSQVPLAPIPPQVLLVSLPGILVHPPNHRYHALSLCVSQHSLRQCLNLKALNPDVECRAWTALAEIGMKVIEGGFSENDEHPWAKGVELEVEKAIGKGLLISQKHPSLRAFRHHLNLLNAQFSQWQHNFKYARSILRRLLTSFIPSDPFQTVYSAHLALISQLVTPPPTPASNPTLLSSPQPQSQDIHAALDAVATLQALAIRNMHPHVVLLTHVLRLRICVAAGMWNQVQDALTACEAVLGLSYAPAGQVANPSSQSQSQTQSAQPSGRTNSNVSPQEFISFEDPFEVSMAIHVLIIGVTFYTHAAQHSEASPRLSHLHALLDSGALEKFPYGIVEIAFSTGPPLAIHSTHPRVLYLLTFLLSSAAKRDPVGRKPKRKIFATEGLAVWEREVMREMMLPAWAGVGDAFELEQRVVRIKADILCELIGTSIQRSEFDAAETHLNLLIAHTRTYSLFPSYASRITLHHAHLAHALGNTTRAMQCYRVAADLDGGSGFIGVAARAGEVLLRIGINVQQAVLPQTDMGREEQGPESGMDEETKSMAVDVSKKCRGMGGNLEAVGQIIEAATATEILKSKNHLKHALGIVSRAQDNHLRALLLALISTHYLHTAPDHAQTTLIACEQLAAGLGAVVKVEDGAQPLNDAVGNAPLRLWVGERFLELFKRSGKDAKIQKQTTANAELENIIARINQRGLALRSVFS